MGNYKLIFIPIMLLAIVIGVSGCMKSGKPEKEVMMEFMKNKYNEDFEFVSIGNEAWNAKYTEMIVHSEKFPEGRIVVRKYGDKILDNYTDFLMKEKIEEEMSDLVAQVYHESKVFYTPGGIPMGDEVNPNMSVQEYSVKRNLFFPLTICVSDLDYQANKQQKIEELRQILELKKYRCELKIFYILEDKLALINDTNIHELRDKGKAKKWIVSKGSFFMDNSYQFSISEWRVIE